MWSLLASPAFCAGIVSYDSYGRADQVVDGAGTTTYSFDDNDGVTNKSVSFSGGPNASLSYSYYPDGSLSQTSTPAGVFNYTYDKAQRLTDLTNPQGQGTHYKYFANDWLQRQADYYGPESSGTGVLMDYTYDPLGEPTAIANDQFLNQNGTYQPTFNNITYNGLGQITAYTSTNTGTVNYTYDSLNRLHTESNNGIINNSYVSDAANNLTTIRGGSVTYNADNQRATAIYDGNGNLTSTTLTYDAENRMTAFNGTVSETNGYFSDGLRAWNNTSAGKTFFLYDGDTPVCELSSNGTVTATNTFGPNGLVSRTSSGTTNWYTFDPQGNTSVIYQGFNNSSSQYVTDAYGAMVSGTFTTPYDGFGGQFGNYHDPTTGWFLMGHRFYAAGQARFVNRDPIGYGGGINQYAYTGNDPMNGADPSGFGPNDNNWIIQALPWLGFLGPEFWNGPGHTDRLLARLGLRPLQCEGDPDPTGLNEFMSAVSVPDAAGMMANRIRKFLPLGGQTDMTTVIGKMHDLRKFDNDPNIDTWAKSGRIPGEGDPPVGWSENQQWLDQRIDRGDSFGIATPEDQLSNRYVAGEPNGNFTFRELRYLRGQGIEPTFMP